MRARQVLNARRLTVGIASAALAVGALVAGGTPASANGCSWFVAGHAGTEADPNPISTADDLTCLQDNSIYWDQYFVLTDDIDMGGDPWTAGIGESSATPFSGTFDGGGHTISGLAVEASGRNVGLFGYVSSTGTVLDLTISGTVTATGTNYVVGGLVGVNIGTLRDVGFSGSLTGGPSSENVGGVAGWNEGTVTGGHSSGTVTGGAPSAFIGGVVGRNDEGATVAASSSAADVSGTSGAVVCIGGLVGLNASGSVISSYATGSVAGTAGANAVGGLVGVSYTSTATARIVDSYATGSVTASGTGSYVGGLAGWSIGGEVSNSYATGAVTGMGDTTASGGLIGQEDGAGSVTASYVTASYWDTTTTGQSSSDGGTGRTTAQMTDPSTFSDWSIAQGWSDSTTWGICSRVNSGYPFLSWQFTSNPCLAPPVRFTFTFDTSNGGVCFSDTQVAPGPYVLPDSRVACTPEGTELVGWTIPGQDRPFSDGGTVIASADQTFTAVARFPTIEVTYDANVGERVACLVDGSDVEERTATVSVGRDGTLASTAPCAPAGVTFAGWTDRPTLDGPGRAVDGAMTLAGGADVPGSWSQDPDPVNAITLYALWVPAD